MLLLLGDGNKRECVSIFSNKTTYLQHDEHNIYILIYLQNSVLVSFFLWCVPTRTYVRIARAGKGVYRELKAKNRDPTPETENP